MVMNHRIEIYLLDRKGNIKGFWAEPGKKMILNSVKLDPIKTFLSGSFDMPLLGCDPRHENIFKNLD